MKINGHTIEAYADLYRADFCGADLSGADLRGALFQGASLRGVDFRGALLSGASFAEADLYEADFRGARLCGANFRGARLCGTDFRDAHLAGANLNGASLPHFSICPQVGSFQAYKRMVGGVLLVEIPDYAKRTSSLIGRKCRASAMRIVAVAEMNAVLSPTVANLFRERTFESFYRHARYTTGMTYTADDYSDDIRVECAPGLHFYMTLEEAREG